MNIATASRSELVAGMVSDATSPYRGRSRPVLVVDANGHALSLRATDAEYRAAVDASDVIHADGAFLVTLSRWLTDTPIVERSATTDLIHDAAAAAASHGLTFYLLGGSEAVNARCAEVLQEDYPGLRVVGRHHGYFDDITLVVADIRATNPDVIWVGMGKPREQLVGLALREHTDAAWIVTCGGCFNFVVGTYHRAPQWMQRANLEWLYRMARQPRKLFWRYAVTNPHALFIALTRTRRHGPDG